MSANLPDEQAWLWYDTANLEIRHVGFKPGVDHGIGLSVISIPYQQAIDIVSGKHRLGDFELVSQDQEIVFRRRKIANIRPKFWHLIDPEKTVMFGSFGSSEDAEMPVEIKDKNEKSFTVDVIKSVKNIQFYITMRNDPNYLIKTIDLYPAAYELGSTNGIKIDVDLGHDYSIYVRYDAA